MSIITKGTINVAIISPIESNGGIPVNIQDQTSEIVDVRFRSLLGTFTLASNATIDTRVFTATAGHGIQVGDYIVFKETPRFMAAFVVNVATNTITIDRPFDYAFTTSCTATRGSTNMAVNGSVTPVIFKVTPAGLNFKVDFTYLKFVIKSTDAMDESKFGSLTALTNGIVLRKKDGTYKNIFAIRTNGGFDLQCESINYIDKSGAGQYAFNAIKKFSGQENSGVAIRLDGATNDELQIIIQDDLSSLAEFSAVAHGHVVQG